jgi:hypothetical protein
MGFIQRAEIVPALPNMPRRVVECVPVGSKSAVCLLHRLRKNSDLYQGTTLDVP